ncbi:MAG: DUF1223 domain-containing protein [Candidatus Acidiferrales bacterium]
MTNFSGMMVKASLMLFGLCAVLTLPCQAQTPATPDSNRKPVLVELFTAEGCSSCPPAEALALQMEKQPLPGIDMIVLEEHVDYWNQDGWVDPFSSADWTDRQKDYVSKLANGNPYTPEMVVDGQSQFTGSHGREAQKAIEDAARGPETNVTVTEGKQYPKGAGDFEVSVGKLEGSAAGDEAEVWVAVTEDGLHSAVSAGENAGHTLYHAAVLRYLHKIGVAEAKGDAASFTGDARVKFKSNWKHENLNVVVFVQERKSRQILGAASTKLAS